MMNNVSILVKIKCLECKGSGFVQQKWRIKKNEN